MALEKYEGPGTIIFDRSTQVEAQSVRVSFQSNDRPVTTMRKGLAGRSLGPAQSSIAVQSAIPRAGMEGEILQKCVAKADVTVVIVLAGKRYSYEGWIDSVDHEQNQDGPATVSFTVTAGPPTIT